MPYPVSAVRGRIPVYATTSEPPAPTGEYYKVVTIDHTQIPSDQSDFPVLISFASDSDIAAHVVTGDDVYVTSSDGSTELPHEIEYFSPVTGELALWFKAPSVSSSVDSTFRLYYGGEHANSEDIANVWDDGYVAVHHFGYQWREVGTQPILDNSGSETVTAWGSIVKSGGDYHMYYAYDPAGNGINRIGHATSADGISWTKDAANNPVLTVSTGKFDAYSLWLPRVWIEGGTWYMLYTGRAAASPTVQKIGLATSPDGVTWTKQNSGNAVLQGTTSSWDENDTELSSIIKVGSTYYMFYNTLSSGTRQTGLATSTNLITWTKDTANNPIFGGGRFCGDVFKIGNYYYYIVPHYAYNGDYSELELWRDTSPTFYPADREFIGVAKSVGPTGLWNVGDQDVPWILTDSITRDAFTVTNGELYCYLSGTDGSTWTTGLIKGTPAQFSIKGAGYDSKGTHDLYRGGTSSTPPYQVEEGNPAGAFGFSGSRQYGIPQSTDFNLSSSEPFSLEASVTPASTAATYRCIFSLRDYSSAGTTAAIVLFQYNDDLYALVRQDGGAAVVDGTYALTLVNGTTYRVGLTRDASGNVDIWLNGVAYRLAVAVSGALTPDQGPWIGSHYRESHITPDQGYIGNISEVRFSNVLRDADWQLTATAIELGSAISLGAEQEA